jgi:hypothetical protein
MSEQIDDSDLEPSQLASTSVPPASAPADSEAAVAPSRAIPAAWPPSPVRHISVAERRPLTQQLVRAASVVGLLTLLIAVGLLIPSGNRAALVRFLTPPTPSPTRAPQPGDDAFLWEHFVPWGSLLVDGKPGPDVRSSAVRQTAQGVWEGAAFHLPRGRHTLEYRAAPFPTLTCALSVPAALSDTCPLDRSLDPSLAPGAPATRVLDLRATLDRLPGAQADALMAAAQAQLSALVQRLGVGTLSAGDHFLDFTGDILQTPTTMQLAPQFALDTSIRQYDGLPCATLCTQGDLVPQTTSIGDWPVVASVMLTFRYTNAAGEVLMAEGPATLIGASPHTLISLVTRWQNGTWQTPTPVVETGQIDPVICPTARQTLEWFLDTTAPENVDGTVQMRFAASTADLGCLLAGSETGLDTGSSTGPIAWILYRAGALVAANAEAHRAFPTLPLASAHERALAQAVAPTSLG